MTNLDIFDRMTQQHQRVKAEMAFRENSLVTTIAPSRTTVRERCFAWHILGTFLIKIQIYLTSYLEGGISRHYYHLSDTTGSLKVCFIMFSKKTAEDILSPGSFEVGPPLTGPIFPTYPQTGWESPHPPPLVMWPPGLKLGGIHVITPFCQNQHWHFPKFELM